MLIAVGSKENVSEDVHVLARRYTSHPNITVARGKDLRQVISEKSSNLFLPEDLVIVVVDPSLADIDAIKGNLDILKDRANVIVYFTSDTKEPLAALGKEVVVLEKDKGKRVRERVRAILKVHDKKMTDKAFNLLSMRIHDESMIDQEVLKLIGYVGDKKTIESRDIDAVVSGTHEESLMAFFEAFSRTERKEALSIFENLLENGQHILAIQSYLVNQVRLLVQVKDIEALVVEAKVYPAFAAVFKRWKENVEVDTSEKKRYLPYQHPYYAFKLSGTSARIQKKTLVDFFDFLGSLDVRIKSGTKNERVLMEYGLLKV